MIKIGILRGYEEYKQYDFYFKTLNEVEIFIEDLYKKVDCKDSLEESLKDLFVNKLLLNLKECNIEKGDLFLHGSLNSGNYANTEFIIKTFEMEEILDYIDDEIEIAEAELETLKKKYDSIKLLFEESV